MTQKQTAKIIFDNRVTVPMENDGRVLRYRLSPHDAKVWSYVVRSDFCLARRPVGQVYRRAVPSRADQPKIRQAFELVD